MNKVKWTQAQRDAISARGGDVLVSAAAGSGKTAVLVQRIIEAITDPVAPVSIDRMLIVTFTRAATFEMRQRLENALDELLRNDPYNKYLLNQKQLLYSASILTIDGFCSDFVKRYFYKLDIQRDFRVPDDGEKDILRGKALENTLGFFYSQSDSGFLDLVSAVCTLKSDDNLRKNIISLYNYTRAFPFPEVWLDEKLGYYDADGAPFTETPFYKYIMKFSEECLLYCLELCDNNFRYIELDTFLPEDKLDKIRDTIRDDHLSLDAVNSAVMERDWDRAYELLQSFKLKTFPRIVGAGDDRYKELILENRKTVKSEIEKAKALISCRLSDVRDQTDRMYRLVKALFDCVRRFESEYNAIKAEKNLLEFSDIEHLAIRLLCENKDGELVFSDISREISDGFDLIMVDEFQDINEAQSLLFRAISRDKGNLFVVGDVKQSIYGFRQAKPEIFIDYKNRYVRYDRENPAYPAKIILDKNFRSRLGITEACNFVFSTLMSPELGGLEYNDEERLVCGAEYRENGLPNMELTLIDGGEVNKEEDETKIELEARHVAERIWNLVYEEKMTVRDGDGERPVTFGDIAILLRSAKGDARRAVIFADALREYGIPVVSELKSNFFEQNEIKVVLNCLRIIDNPVQDIPLLSVMFSPMFGFNADELAEIRAEHRNMPLFNAIKLSSKANAKCAALIDFIDSSRSLAVTTTVDRLIGAVIRSTGFLSVTKAVSRSCADNLCLLQDYARRFSENGYKTLTAFVGYIDRLTERGTILNGSDSSSGEALNAVSVMSIHASKGLEFPVCFISSVSTQFNLADVRNDMVLDSIGGIGLRYREGLIKYDTIQRKAVSMMLRDSQISEEMRILYVALTRAKERLIITSTVPKPEEYIKKLEAKITSYPISPYVVRNAHSFSDWLFTCAVVNPSTNLRKDIEPDFTNYKPTDKPWVVTIATRQSVEENERETRAVSEKPVVSAVDPRFMESFLKRVSFVYKNKPLETLPQKVSASELSHKDNNIFGKILRKPAFLDAKASSGAEAGTAFHTFMERCDLASARKDVLTEARGLREKGFLTERQFSLLDFDKLSAFLNGELIERILKSGKFAREYTFTVKINASDYDPEISKDFSDRKIIMQGAVDLVFEEDGELVVLDYKTDRVKEAQKLRELYQKQLDLYKKALEETTGKRVKETVLYSIYLNKRA